MKFVRALLIACLTFSLSILGAAAPLPMTLKVNGVERQALVFAPSLKTSDKAPLVLAFHGHGANMNSALRVMALQNAWPEAIIVYPQGLPTVTDADPQGLKPGWQDAPGQNNDRDLRFVDALVAQLRQKFPVNEGHIYATGFSNGGRFIYLLWSQRPRLFAGFAICAGLIREPVHVTIPKPLLHIAGEKDQLAPFQRQQETIATAREINGCADNGQSCGEGCTLYSSSKSAPVEVMIHHGGHIYPPTASPLIVRFFKTATPE